MTKKGKKNYLLLLGVLGCLCYGGGDWLMMYGDPTPLSKSLYWLTEGVTGIAPWRNGLAMALAFPGIILYGIALFSLERYISTEKDRKVYHWLNIFGLTPWMALHLFYIMILFGFQYMMTSGYADAAVAVSEAVYQHLSWVVLASEALMLPVFIWFLYLLIRGRTALKRRMALAHVFVIYAVLYVIRLLLPASAFRIGFTNGMMSESMLVFFLLFFFLDGKMQREAEIK